MLVQGLRLVGFNIQRVQNVSLGKNLRRFLAHYGSNPIVYAKIWEDLQVTQCLDALIDSRTIDLALFLMTFRFLKCYPTEAELAATFRVCERTVRKWCRYYGCKIQALKEVKVSSASVMLWVHCRPIVDHFLTNKWTRKLQIVWPTRWTPCHVDFSNEDIPVFLLTVDGVHCQIHEPMHPTKSKDQSYYSHKFKRSALNYEVGVSVYDNALVWLSGPTKASQHDITIFRSPDGLKEIIPDGRRVIGDRGYASRREAAVLSTPNSSDPTEVRKFKSRARARHESFNGKIKNFRVLSECFRHNLEDHKTVFEAICVICQYQLENGSPLFDT
jgi:hypothetical protein